LAAQPPEDGAPVRLGNTVLFRLHQRIGSFSAQERADTVSRRILTLAEDVTAAAETLSVVETEVSSDVVHRDRIVLSVTDRDAAAAGQPRAEMARAYARIMQSAMVTWRNEHSRERIARSLAVGALATGVFVLVLLIAARLTRRLHLYVRSMLSGGTFENFAERVLGPERYARAHRNVWRVAYLIFFLGLLHAYLLVIAAQFPGARSTEQVLVDSLLRPVLGLGTQFVSHLPDLIYVAVVIAAALAFNKLLRLFFRSIETEQIHIDGFYPDWAEPTYKLSALIVFVAALIVAFPYIPGSSSPAFRAVSVLAGVLFSIGSTSLIGNAFAGVVLIYMRSFKIGDRVRIADTMGDVEDKNLLVTRVKTVKNEHITIANSMILGSHVVNYSKAAQEDGVIFYTSVTIGYDAPWRTVHELLVRAAARTEFVSSHPAPFVLQTQLHDSYVEYQINVYTRYPQKMTSIYSELRANIQDSFNEAGVEIMSPAYHAVRDGNHVTIPKSHLPADYESPGFRVLDGNRAQAAGAGGSTSAGRE
jgi:small-conductance mechanosensitive channel